jgi:hypothetical protein
MAIVPSRSYFDDGPQRWSWTLGSADVPMESYHFTVAQWVEMLGGVPSAAISARSVIQMICERDGKQFSAQVG